MKPFLAINGYTTPDEFTTMATRKNVLSGFMGRSLMFVEEKNAPRKNKNYKKSKIGRNLDHELKKIYSAGYAKHFDVGRIQFDGEKKPVTTAPDALDYLAKLDDASDDAAEKHENETGYEALFLRKIELILKVSLVLAVGDGCIRTMEHVKWAEKLVNIDFTRKLEMLNDNETHKGVFKTEDHKSKIVRLLKKDNYKNGATLKVIVNRIRGMETEDAVPVLTELVKSGIITSDRSKKIIKFKMTSLD